MNSNDFKIFYFKELYLNVFKEFKSVNGGFNGIFLKCFYRFFLKMVSDKSDCCVLFFC